MILSTAVVVVVAMLSALLCSTSLLSYDSGTYDAGITTAVLSTSTYDPDAYSLLVVVLVHELLVLCIAPMVT